MGAVRKILMVAPEVAPLVKVGGLADVVGALTKTLADRGHDVRVLLPKYQGLQGTEGAVPDERPLIVRLGGHEAFARVWECPLPGSVARCHLLEYNRYFDGPSVYSAPFGPEEENGRRFAFLSRAAVELCYHLDWFPDIVHCHDWAAALTPVYLNTLETGTPMQGAASVLTLHNMQHQGCFSRHLIDFAGFPPEVFRPDGLESMGGVNFLKGGIFHATKITTVSPTYAGEIQEPTGGHGLHNILRFRTADLVGVINGIDKSEWNPSKDALIPACFSLNDMKGKEQCKSALQEAFGLSVESKTPVFVVVSRLVEQKGLDLLAASADRLMEGMHIQVAVLGSGEPGLEGSFRELAVRYPGRFATHIGFDNQLAHLAVAGGDFLIMPSRFEPCGLSQMYAMTYGTPPIVRATGGLIDSVECYIEGTGLGAGFVFHNATPEALHDTVGWACSTYYDRPEDMAALRRNGMDCDFSWDASASIYEDVYEKAVSERRAALPSSLSNLSSGLSPTGC
ncbi:MAG: glycogen synthase GlgA [Opitutales bacterium]